MSNEDKKGLDDTDRKPDPIASRYLPLLILNGFDLGVM